MLKTIVPIALLTSSSAFADVTSPVVDARQAHQGQRIVAGVQTGQLTRVETARLVTQQARNRAFERRLESDGRLSVDDRVRIDRRLDRSSRAIAIQKHDRQRR